MFDLGIHIAVLATVGKWDGEMLGFWCGCAAFWVSSGAQPVWPACCPRHQVAYARTQLERVVKRG